jgi:murein DD-endopeptidase MepM/ murein hydrolase activator NlpD
MRRTFWVAITLALAAYLALPLPGLSRPLSERISSTRDRIQDHRAQEGVLSTTIQRFNTRIESLQGEINDVRRREDEIQAELDEKRAELTRVRNRLEIVRDELIELRGQLAVAEDALADRLVQLYKADEPDALTVVLEAEGFGDLLERTEFLERVADQDKRILDRVRELKAATERKERELARLEDQVEEVANAIQARRDEVRASRTTLETRQGELVSTRDGRRAALDRIRNSRSRLEGDLAHFEREQSRVMGVLQNAASGGGGSGGQLAPAPIRRGSGQLIWPVSGPVVSGFGQRWGRLHAGIDIAVPSGTPIRAAASGTVSLLGVVGGYGNYTCVSHGGSLSTCYAHQSRYATSGGASVRQGQVIGFVGCTGRCFGDHLHFEVRVGGSPVDPMGYL